MNTLVVFAAVVVAVAASPMGNYGRNMAAQDGQFVLAKDFSFEDGPEYSVKYVKSYNPGGPWPAFHRNIDSSEEVRHYLASNQGRKAESWSDRVKKLRNLLTTGFDLSDERNYMYNTGTSNLPAGHQYFVDSSGEIYYDANAQNKANAVAAVP